MEPTYTVDGNGDTLLILYDPNRPFEAVDDDDLWDNHLPLYDDFNVYKSRLLDDKREHHLREASVNHPPPKNPGKEVSWRVSLRKLKSASMTFQILAAENRKEDELFEQGYKYTIRAEGWSAQALHKLILRSHGEDAGLYELQSNPKLCAQLAVVVDEYQCHNLFQLRFPVVTGRYPYNENLLFWLFSSWVFRDEANFRESSKAIIIQTRGRMHTLGMPIPESLISKYLSNLYVTKLSVRPTASAVVSI
ncbi:hypothetical protein M441DRAFT_460491 [Trichoderma asperellum CBS 433.97]|uniref:Uncharacterized protein n=1 Tax=Trichoderma asperellum (strain ATCC 204424 / CBS 433.97 / NBRC 101777) TaxID=1042311 RepID=A0A2T3Z416_TRIA4|nr:hypothetical protein M441DRAFT_460491 [Trichoderma asperellum CBS 433.97]PTB39500.1 hypothetical protein M441DRAFT_460491 [Trichoderma asperellum CBS 433.97]